MITKTQSQLHISMMLKLLMSCWR